MSVATATTLPFTLPRMPSDRALPAAHVCTMPGGADLYPLWMVTASLELLIPR